MAFGKENASSALLDVQSLHGVLAVLDADFDHILQKIPASTNIILTDTHDIECMLVASTALDQILVEFGSHEKLASLPDHSNSVRNILLESARPIALLPLAVLPNHSETEPAFSGLCLSDLRFADIIDDATLETDIGLLIRAVKNRSQRQDLNEGFAETRLRDYCSRHRTSDPWQLCRGHDMTAILLRGLFSRLGSQKPCQLTQERLEASLRLAYSLPDFKKTSL